MVKKMTDSERAKILRMIEEGKITPEEGLHLMQVLEKDPVDNEEVIEPPSEAAPRVQLNNAPDPGLNETVEKARSLWVIPLWIGIFVTFFGGWVMYQNIHGSQISAWFYCLGFPIFLLGLLIMVLGIGSRTSRWVFVSVDQKPGDHPEHIRLGFPLPLGLAAWALRNFGPMIKELRNAPVDQVLEALKNSDEPLVVNVDEGDNGEKVQVYIG